MVLHHRDRHALHDSRMRCIGETRRLRLIQLKREMKLTFADMSVALGRSRRDATLSQVAQAQPNSRTGRPRQLGDDQARLIERTFGREEGWMDRDPDFEALLERVGFGVAELETPYLAFWPFRGIAPADWALLSVDQQAAVEAVVASMLPAKQTAAATAVG